MKFNQCASIFISCMLGVTEAVPPIFEGSLAPSSPTITPPSSLPTSLPSSLPSSSSRPSSIPSISPSSAPSLPPTNSPTGKKPNILVIFGDDIGTGDVPGNLWSNTSIVEMPHLEDLASKGISYTDVHSTPLCAPSRYVFLSGNYQHRGEAFPGLWNLNYKTNQFKKGQQSLADVLGASGYRTAMFGKWHMGGKVPQSAGFKPPDKFYVDKKTIIRFEGHDWTKPLEAGPTDIGFHSSYITTGGIQNPPYVFFRDSMLESDPTDMFFYHAHNYSSAEGTTWIKTSGEGDRHWDSSAYNKIIFNETEAFLEDHVTNHAQDPFFAYVALGAVHVPHSPPDRYFDGTPIAGSHDNGHLDVLYEMDKIVGSLVKSLEERQLLEDTIIIFTSDNGGLGKKHTTSMNYGHLSNGYLRGSKGQIWEGGTRVPLLIRWDKGQIPQNQKRSNLVGLNDIFSTVCELADVDVPENQAIDSTSFAKNIYDPNEDTREFLGTWEYLPKDIYHESIRKNEMKFVRDNVTNKKMLYNLTEDIGETNDISLGNEALIDEMYEKLKTISPCYDDVRGFIAVDKKGRGVLRNCNWFANKKTNNRCKQHPIAFERCRKTCSLSNKKYCTVSEFPFS